MGLGEFDASEELQLPDGGVRLGALELEPPDESTRLVGTLPSFFMHSILSLMLRLISPHWLQIFPRRKWMGSFMYVDWVESGNHGVDQLAKNATCS